MTYIILDRDGVINEDSDEYIKSLDEWIPIEGSLDAMAKLYHAGYRIIVLTNQSGIARGYFSLETLNAMHDKLQALLGKRGAKVEAIFYCPHGPNDTCDCRKPKPGLFHQAAKTFALDLNGVLAVGDSWRDIEAAQAAGASPVLVKTGKGQQTASKHKQDLLESEVPIFDNLASFVDSLLG